MKRASLAVLSLGFLLGLFLTGCGTRLTDAQAKELAQAKADAAAAAACNDAAARNALFAACGYRVSAATAHLDLPEPMTLAAVLVQSDGTPNMPAVEQEVAAAKAAAEDPPSGMLGLILGGVGGVGLFALGILRSSPGAFGLVANVAHSILAPRATKDMRAAQAKAQDVADAAVAYGHAVTAAAIAAGLGDTVKQIQQQAAAGQDKLGIRPLVDAILAKYKTGRKPPLPGAAGVEHAPTTDVHPRPGG